MSDLSMHLPLDGRIESVVDQNNTDTEMQHHQHHHDQHSDLPVGNGNMDNVEEDATQLGSGDMHNLQGLINASLAQDNDENSNLDEMNQQEMEMHTPFIHDKDTFQLNNQSNIQEEEDEESMLEAVSAAAAAVAAMNKRRFYDTTDMETSNKKLHIQSSSNTTAEEQDDNSNTVGLLNENANILGHEDPLLGGSSSKENIMQHEPNTELDDPEVLRSLSTSPFKNTDPRSNFIRFALNKTAENPKRNSVPVPDAANNNLNASQIQTTSEPSLSPKKSLKKDTVKANVPKNSRVFKVYSLEGQKLTIKGSSMHHYNPYRYPQNRSKFNPHPDFMKSVKVDTTSAFDSSSMTGTNPAESKFDTGAYLVSGIKAPKQEIPVFHPTMAQFEDIYSYIDSIKDVGKKYGAVKIVPPKEYAPKFAINIESFWIKSTRQSWRPPVDEINARCEFYSQLKDCLQGSLNKLPCIDKRSIDLYRLYRVVKLRGGYQGCCVDKLWAQVGRELGFYGKISSSLSSSIKAVYQKYIIPWEKKFENVEQDFLNFARNDKSKELFPKNAKTIDMESSLNSNDWNTSNLKLKFETQPEIAAVNGGELSNSQNNSNTETTHISMPNLTTFSSDLPEEAEKTEKLPIILGSSNVYNRSRQMLANSGFTTYYDQATTQKKGITLNDSQTLIGYDFYKWMGTERIDDTVPTEMKISSLYTLKQFHDKSRILKNQILNKFYPSEHQKFDDPIYLENNFWNLLQNEDAMFETEVSTHQSSNIHDSSNEYKFLSDKGGPAPNSFLSSLNFNNVSVCDGSLQPYMDADTDSFFSSYLNFNMFYGSQSWSVEDSWFYKLDYHYLGDAKSVYAIPPEFQEKYEELLNSKLEERKKEIDKTADAAKLFEKVIFNYDIFNASLENQTCFDVNLPRATPLDPHFRKLSNISNVPKRYNSDLMLSPNYLKENGIPVYHTFQNTGEMIIKFPKAYTSYFSLGTSVTESVNIANLDWLNVSLDLPKWYQKQDMLPKFSINAMLLTAAYESTDKKILTTLQPLLQKFVEEELEKRKELKTYVSKEFTFDMSYEALREIDFLQRDYEAKNQVGFDSLDEVETVGSRLVSKLSKWNRFADADLGDVFPSFIIAKLKSPERDNSIEKTSTFTLSTDYFMEKYKELNLSNSEYEFELISLVTDDYLKESLTFLNAKLETMEQWHVRFLNVLNADTRPPIKLFEDLCKAGECIFKINKASRSNLSSEQIHIMNVFTNAKKVLSEGKNWVKKAALLLSIRDTNSDSLIMIKDIKLLVSEIPRILVSSPEEDEILQLAKDIQEFEKNAREALNKPVGDLDMNQLLKLQTVGAKLRVDLKSFKLIDQIVKKNLWKVNLNKEIGSLEELERLYEQGASIPNLTNSDKEALTELKQKIETTANISKEYERIREAGDPINYQEIEQLYQKIGDLPLDEAKKYFKSLIDEYKSLEGKVSPLINLVEEKCALFKKGELDFSEGYKQFINYNKRATNIINEEKIHRKNTLKSLKRFEDLSAKSDIFNMQLIEGPNLNEGMLNAHFRSILTFGRDDIRFVQPVSETDSLVYYKNYNLSVLNSSDDAYCVCKQGHEGNMVECEMCQQWFHFNCIGYQSKGSPGERDNKYLCSLCDYERKLLTTKKFQAEISNKLTFEEMQAAAMKMMERSCLLTEKGLVFLDTVNAFHSAFKQIMSQVSVENVAKPSKDGIEANYEGAGATKDIFDPAANHLLSSTLLACRSTDLALIRKLLEKINGCLFNYSALQHALQQRYVELCRLRDGSL